VTIHTLWGRASDLPDSQSASLAQWERFLAAYRAQSWQAARECLAVYRQGNPNPTLCHHYETLIQNWQAHPPLEDWDGSTRFDTK
jgi:adenylate cyclase